MPQIITLPPGYVNPSPVGPFIQNLGGIMMSTVQDMINKRDRENLLKMKFLEEYGGEFTPEQIGMIENELFPQNPLERWQNKGNIPQGKTGIGEGLRAENEPGPIEMENMASGETPIKSLQPNRALPQPGSRMGSLFQSLFRPTGEGTYKFPGRMDREIETHGKIAEATEKAKWPYRQKELEHKSNMLEAQLETKEHYYDIIQKHYKDLETYYKDRIDMAEKQMESKERIAELNAMLKEILLKQKDIDRTRELDLKEREIARKEEEGKKKGEMSERENVKAFEEEAIARGWLKVDPKSKARTWNEFNADMKDMGWKDFEELARQYGYDVNWTERTGAWPMRTKTWIPTVNYKTARSERKGTTTTQKKETQTQSKAPTEDEWVKLAKEKNPNTSEEELRKYYKQKYGKK